LLKQLFWVYFLLLIFEGALRKWILPQFSAPLLLVRDPVGLLIIVEAFRSDKWPEKWSAVTGVLTAGLLGLCLIQVVGGGNPWIAALYGLRSYLLPFPVVFVMGENLDAEDLREFGLCTLWLLLPLTLLEVAQYLAPEGSILNVGAYEGAEQISYAGTHVRASSTFSYVTGPSAFGPLAGAFLLYSLVNEKFGKRWLVWAASFALILSIPVIGSRGMVIQLVAVVGCAGIAALCGVSQFLKTLRIVVPLLLIFGLVSLLPIFSEASGSLMARFADASENEGGVAHAVQSRTVGGILNDLEQIDFASNPVGRGMGQGSAAIAKLSTGQATFTAGENELTRELIELGAIPGIFFATFRLGLAGYLVFAAIARARKLQPLALLLVPLTVSSLLLGAMEQPTGQGFMVIGLAFSLAALKRAPAQVAMASRVPQLRRASWSAHG
jgi:hypothetical protein